MFFASVSLSIAIAAEPLAGFERSPQSGEQVTTWTADGGVTVHVNAPSPDLFDAAKPTRLILYALPNGNTIAWTVGKQVRAGDDWHFGIQHIGAQTRLLRELDSRHNIVTAYLEAQGRSWPGWRRKHPDNAARIAAIVTEIRDRFADWHPSIELTAHSGGGSFIFGFLNSADAISSDVTRIALLDANYGYSDDDHHGEKLLKWLTADKARVLSVIAYDDRNITLNGKPVVGPDGGTWRATHRMIARLGKDTGLTSMTVGDQVLNRGMDGRVEMILHTNPKNEILHTVLVEKNGFLRATLLGTKEESVAPPFFGEAAYGRFITRD
jgi:hypothetical protein